MYLLTTDREELKTLFDTQINRMLALTDKQFDRMQTKLPRTQIVGTLELLYVNH